MNRFPHLSTTATVTQAKAPHHVQSWASFYHQWNFSKNSNLAQLFQLSS